MDLLRQSGYDSSNEGSDDENSSDDHDASAADRHEKKNAANLGDDGARHSISSAAPRRGGGTAPGEGARPTAAARRKRPRNDGDGHDNGGARGADSSSSARGQGSSSASFSKFVRSVPHTPGNWAGHVFAPLTPDPHSSSSPYDATNRQSSKVLFWVAHDLIEEFESELGRRSDGRFSGPVVSHGPKDFADGSSSDSEDIDSDGSGGGDDDNDRAGVKDDDAREKSPIDCGRRKHSRLLDGSGESYRQPDNLSPAANPLHLSLSRPFYLQLPSIASFVSELRKRLLHLPPVPVALDPAQPEILVNDDATRSFLTIPATEATSQGIVRMIRAADVALRKFGQEPYYEEARVHVSIASCPGDVRGVLRGLYGIPPLEDGEGRADSRVPRGARGYVSGHCENRNPVTFVMERVCCTFGTTKEYTIHLRT